MSLIFTIIWGCAILCGPLAAICFCVLGCTGIPMLAMFIVTGIKTLGEDGAACRQSAFEYKAAEDENDALTFAADGDQLKKLWISQLILHIPMTVCGVMGICMWMAGAAALKLEGGFMRM